jgi:hypothetical protein
MKSYDKNEFPTNEDYIMIKDNDIPKYFLWFLVMSLFWRYEFD